MEDDTLTIECEPESEQDFLKKEIKLVIHPKQNTDKDQTFYIKHAELYLEVFNSTGQLIEPGTQTIEGVTKHYYRLFKAS